MKLIAVLGVLFVLASCSDSDIPENFGVSCYLDDKTFRYFFEFDFDKNIVKIKSPPIEGIENYFHENQDLEREATINEISSVSIVFEDMGKGNISSLIYTFDRASFIIRNEFIVPHLNYSDSLIYICEAPKI